MADQPKRSAFDPDPPKVKGVPDSERAKPASTSSPGDTTTTPDHEKGLVESIKGLIKQHMEGGKAPGGEIGGKAVSVDSAVDQMSQAVKSAPGSSDYG